MGIIKKVKEVKKAKKVSKESKRGYLGVERTTHKKFCTCR